MEKSLNSGEDSRNRQVGVMLRIFGDVVADGAEVKQRLCLRRGAVRRESNGFFAGIFALTGFISAE